MLLHVLSRIFGEANLPCSASTLDLSSDVCLTCIVRRPHVRALCHREVVGSEGHLPLHKRAAAQQEACAQQPCPVPHPKPFLVIELCVICGSLQRPHSQHSRPMGCNEETGCTESKQLQVVMSSRAIATKPPNATHSRTSVWSQGL